MDLIEEVVRRAAPPSLADRSEVSAGATALALEMVATRAGAVQRSRPRPRHVVAAFLLGLGLLGGGVTAAVAGPALFSWLGWIPDAVAQRTFDLGDGTDIELCEVSLRVIAQYGTVSNSEADQQAEEARAFLATHDWDPLIAAITASDIEDAYAIDVERREQSELESGIAPPAATYSGAVTRLMFTLISAEFERAGFLRDGVSLEAAAGPCSGPDADTPR